MALVKKPQQFIRLGAVETRDLYWLWKPYIPSGALTMIHGKGGLGKSHITANIATLVSTGVALPGQTMATKPQPVLILSAEDDLEVILAPRLIEMGADLEKVCFPVEKFVLDKPGVAKLDELMTLTGARIVFIDPIVQYMGGKVDMNRMNEVRTVLTMLVDLAQKHMAAIVFVHHDRKSVPGQTGEDNDSAAGSADFRNASRSSLKVERYPDGRPVMHHEKSNWEKPGPSLVYSIGDDGFEWGEAVDIIDHVPLNTKQRPRAAAVTFLRMHLAPGPMQASEIQQMARDEGFNLRTLDRAKVGLVKSYYSRNAQDKLVWYWKLEEKKLTTKEKQAALEAAKKSAKGFRDANEDNISGQSIQRNSAVEPKGGLGLERDGGAVQGDTRKVGSVPAGGRRALAAQACRDINHGSAVPTLGEWFAPEIPEPVVGGGVGVRDDGAEIGAADVPDDGVGDRRSPAGVPDGAGIASAFKDEIDAILRSQGIEP